MRRWAPWIGLVVSGLFVWLAVRDVDFGEAGKALREASYWALIPVVGMIALATMLRALRWQALFDPRTRPPLGPVVNATLIGLLFNSILPARAGEAARILALHREAGTSRVESLGTAVAERVYDVFMLLVLLFVAEPFLPHVSWLGKAAAMAAVLAVGIALTVVILLRFRERPVVWLLGRVVAPESASRMGANLVQGLASFRHPSIALRAGALTIASWLVLAASAWLLLRGFGLPGGFGGGLLVTIASALVLVIPAAPGGMGQIEAASIVALSAFGVDRSAALSYGIVYHAVNLVPYLVVGYVALQRHSVAVRRRREEQAAALPNESA